MSLFPTWLAPCRTFDTKRDGKVRPGRELLYVEQSPHIARDTIDITFLTRMRNFLRGLVSRRDASSEEQGSYAEQRGKALADTVYEGYSKRLKDDVRVKDSDLRAASEKLGKVIAALGEERVRLIDEFAKSSGRPTISISISIGQHAGDFLMTFDQDMITTDAPVNDWRRTGPHQLLRDGESMAEAGIVELARRVPQHVLPSTALMFDCVSGNIKVVLRISAVSAKTLNSPYKK